MREFFRCLPPIILLALLCSCKSDDIDPKAEPCKPLSHLLFHSTTVDSVVYEYNAQDKIDKMFYYNDGYLFYLDQLEYNQQGQLWKHSSKYELNKDPVVTHELFYDASGKVTKLQLWSEAAPVSIRERIFTYDAQGRLSMISEPNLKTRYEYREDNNVSKTFYEFENHGERLARENHSFDTHDRYYANVPELAVLNIYILKYEPNKNNLTSLTIFMLTHNSIPPKPIEVSLGLTYDAIGMIRGNNLGYQLRLEGLIENNFKSIRYTCD